MGIISGDIEINDADFRGYDDEISREFEQPEIAPTKVSDYDAFDEKKLDARLRDAGVRDVEVALMVVHHWMLDEENFLRKDGYESAERTANSLKTIRENRLRNK